MTVVSSRTDEESPRARGEGFKPMNSNNADDRENRYVFKSSYTADDLRHDVIPPGALYSTIHDLGREQVMEAVPDIERFLTSDDPQLRYVALEVLTLHFKLQQHWETARRFLEQDEDSDCRRMGASALGILRKNTRDTDTLRILAPVVRNAAENLFVRQTAYRAMRSVIQYNPREPLGKPSAEFNFPQDVDWALVDSYLPGGDATARTADH